MRATVPIWQMREAKEEAGSSLSCTLSLRTLALLHAVFQGLLPPI